MRQRYGQLRHIVTCRLWSLVSSPPCTRGGGEEADTRTRRSCCDCSCPIGTSVCGGRGGAGGLERRPRPTSYWSFRDRRRDVRCDRALTHAHVHVCVRAHVHDVYIGRQTVTYIPGPRLWYMTCIVVCMHTQLRDCGGVADYSLRAPSDQF